MIEEKQYGFDMKRSDTTDAFTQHMTPENFVSYAWDMDFRISIADSNLIHSDFIIRASSLAESQGIKVFYLDFSKYNSGSAALSAKENEQFLDAIENARSKSLLWFVNCDSLASLDVDLTYSLRTALTTRLGSNIQSVFVAKKATLLQMFSNSEAPFYQSHFSLTGYSH